MENYYMIHVKTKEESVAVQEKLIIGDFKYRDGKNFVHNEGHPVILLDGLYDFKVREDNMPRKVSFHNIIIGEKFRLDEFNGLNNHLIMSAAEFLDVVKI